MFGLLDFTLQISNPAIYTTVYMLGVIHRIHSLASGTRTPSGLVVTYGH